MQTDPIQEWQRLTGQYRAMGDEELRELARDFADLTETAQQALRGEMHSRRLGDPADIAFDASIGRAPELASEIPVTDDGDDRSHEYTWKTLLCECDTYQQAWQLSEALKQAGIESWIERSNRHSPYHAALVEAENLRLLVAADQLDRARAVAARPIPPEIVEASERKEPEYEPPACPKCGAEDPVLEGVDPENTWRCEQCGEQWTESAGSGDATAPGTGEDLL